MPALGRLINRQNVIWGGGRGARFTECPPYSSPYRGYLVRILPEKKYIPKKSVRLIDVSALDRFHSNNWI